MAATKENERESISALVEETKETEEMAKRLHDIVRRKESVAKMKAIRLDKFGNVILSEPPPALEEEPKKP